MFKINNLNRQFLIDLGTDRESSLDDISSMIIGREMKQIAKDPATPKHLELPTAGMKVNLYSSVVTTSSGSVQCLEQAQHNKREFRKRPKTTQKAFDMYL